MTPEILLVDDSEDDAELFRIAAGNSGLAQPIRWAMTGEDALELLVGKNYEPSLVVLDIRMPGIDGLEVLRRLRQDPRHGRTPVVVLSGSDLESDRAEAKRLGCDLFLTKPATLQGCVEVADLLRTLLASL
jgi:two-component system response regulator